MASDLTLNGSAVLVEGNLGIGTVSPQRIVHVEGGEVHTGGPSGGFSFADRAAGGLVNNPAKGERWVWYAQGGGAHLWSAADAITIAPYSGSFAAEIHGRLQVDEHLTVKKFLKTGGLEVDGGILADSILTSVQELRGMKFPDPAISNIRCRAVTLSLDDPRIPTSRPVPEIDMLRSAGTSPAVKQQAPPPSPGPKAPPHEPVIPRYALAHEYVPNATDRLVVNFRNSYAGGVKIEGNVQVTGVLTHASSRALKDNIGDLSTHDALRALHALTPVTFTYKNDARREQHAGFIAEDVPDLVAKSERTAVSPMDVVAVLTKVVQAQHTMITALTDQVRALQLQAAPATS